MSDAAIEAVLRRDRVIVAAAVVVAEKAPGGQDQAREASTAGLLVDPLVRIPVLGPVSLAHRKRRGNNMASRQRDNLYGRRSKDRD
jgi:hypothetical protein